LHTLALEGSQTLIDAKRIPYHPAVAWNKARRRSLGAAVRPAKTAQEEDG